MEKFCCLIVICRPQDHETTACAAGVRALVCDPPCDALASLLIGRPAQAARQIRSTFIGADEGLPKAALSAVGFNEILHADKPCEQGLAHCVAPLESPLHRRPCGRSATSSQCVSLQKELPQSNRLLNVERTSCYPPQLPSERLESLMCDDW